MTSTRPLGRPPAFAYRNVARSHRRSASPVLCCESISLVDLADRFSTPLYVYSASTIRQRVRVFERAFRKISHTVCYSLKANSNLSILRMLTRMGCGFDIVSGGELERVLRVSRTAARKIVFSGVGKTRDEMLAALKANILLFNVESQSELEVLAECAARLKKTAPIALRVNPDVQAETHPYISTGLHRHKFGIPMDRVRRLYGEACKIRSLKVAGVSVHIGSQITDVSPFYETMERVAELVRALRADGHSIRYIDAGGGLGIFYNEGSTGFEKHAAEYANALLRPLKKLDVHLLLEPGRAIVGPAGALLTRVLYRKTNNSKKFLIVDAAMNDLLRPSLYNAYHEIVPVALRLDESNELTDVVGPVCETGDFFARDRELPVVKEGDLLSILDAGAYGMSLASNYNSRPRPAEVLVEGKSVKLIRRREAIADLIDAED
jgi:diaminopimelate decarboxylase